MKFAVLGAGNGGYAISADLSLAGYDVNLFNRSPDPIRTIRKHGGITISGTTMYGEGLAKIGKVTNNLKKAVEGVDIIMIVVPAFGHEYMIERCIPLLEKDQIIIFNTGNFACLRFAGRLKGLGKSNILAETSSLIYSCRITGPASVSVSVLKRKVPIATFPARKIELIYSLIKEAYPQLSPAANVLQTSFENINTLIHPSIMILNAASIERTGGKHLLYKEGLTNAVDRLIGGMEEERSATADNLGIRVSPILELLKKMYDTKGETVYEALKDLKIEKIKRSNLPNEKSPTNFQNRYITEDVPYGLVPMTSIADTMDVSTPTMKAVIQLWSTINQVDYFYLGVTIEKLGLRNLSAKEIIEFVTEEV